MHEINKLRFNYITMPRRKEYGQQKFSNGITARQASVKNDFEWCNFYFLYAYNYEKHKPMVRVYYEDNVGSKYMGNISSNHPDLDFLVAYITKP